MNTLQRKTWRDLWLYKSRTILVVLAIAVGTAAAGVASTSFIVMRGDLRDGYRGTNPAHAVLYVAAVTGAETTGVDESLAERVAELSEVSGAELRRQTSARLILDGGESVPLQLLVIPDFEAEAIGTLYPQPGASIPPPDGSMLLERSTIPVYGIEQDDQMEVRLLDGDMAHLMVAGFVNDMAVVPSTVAFGAQGYITDATAAGLDIPEGFNQLRITVAENEPDRAAVEAAVTVVTEWLEDEGIAVLRADIPVPGIHIMQGSVNTGLLMISILGGLMLLLSAFLVTNVMSAVIAQQVPIIGVLKAVGGGRRLVLLQYGRMVLLFGLMALALAVPLGLMGAWFQSSYLAGQLNYDIPSFGLPWQTLLLQAAGALLIPALAVYGPVRAAANMTIREALSGQGIGELAAGGLLARLEGLPRPTALVLRNVARRKIRLVLTLVALTLAGAMFIATFSLRLGLYEAVEILVNEFSYTIQIDFVEPESAQRVEQLAAGIDDIDRLETWGVADARRVYPDGRTGSSFPVFGVPETTEIVPFTNRFGRWFSDEDYTTDADVLYINHETEKIVAMPVAGDSLTLKFNGFRERDVQLVGISLRAFEPEAYMPYTAFEQATGERGRAGRLVVYMTDGLAEAEAAARQTAVADELVGRYEAAGMPILRTETAGSMRETLWAQFTILVVLLMALAGLTALVGGLGLANTMALNVLERSREIGILRSMGARRPLLRRLVLAEGLAVAVISGVLAIPLAIPLTLILDRVMGNSLLGSPLSFAFSTAAALGWLALVVVIGLVACWLPAEGAARMTIREALAYE